jgi:hypothetical protein
MTPGGHSYNFNLLDPNDKFPGDFLPNFPRASEPVQGLRLDNAGRPLRFDTPSTSAGNSSSIYDTSFIPPEFLTLDDNDGFDLVLLADGTIRRLVGTPSTPVAAFGGLWHLGGTGREVFSGVYMIRSRGTTPPSSLPAPTDVQATPIGAGVVIMTWVTPRSGPTPTGYRAEYLFGGVTFGHTDGGPCSGPGQRCGGPVFFPPTLQGTFFVVVRALFGGIAGPPSDPPVPFTLGGAGCTGLSAPQGLSGGIVAGGATLRWNPVPGAVSYIVQAGSGPGLSDLFDGNVGNTSIAQASGLPAGFFAFVRVIAVDACGNLSQASSDFLIQ